MTAAKRVRLRFAKCGDLRLVSHHDLMRCLERALRRAALPVAHSQGFNPRPKAVFPLALGLGIEGRREVLELELDEPMEPAEVLGRLRGVMPAGFDFLEAEAAPAGRPSQVSAVQYALEIPPERQGAAREATAVLLATTALPYTRHRPDRTVEIDLRPFVLDAEVDGTGTLRLRMRMDPGGSARPEEVVEALGLRDLLERGAFLVRTEVELAPRPGPKAEDPGPATHPDEPPDDSCP